MRKLREPECLSGYGINWSSYEPPNVTMKVEGEEGEIDMLDERFKPALAQALAICEDAQRVSRRSIAKIAEMRKQKEALVSCVKTAKEFMGDRGSAFFKQWLALSKGVVAEVEERCASLEAEFAVPEGVFANDIGWMKSIGKFMDDDLECDMVLWAIGAVEPKYRIKVFREAYRRVKAIVELSKTIDAFSSPFSEKLPDFINKHYCGCRDRYIGLLGFLKKLKRKVDDYGVDALTSLESTSSFAQGNDRFTMQAAMPKMVTEVA